jgi:uncharacterized protein
MKDILLHIITSIVTNPDQVIVDETESEDVTNFTVTVAKDDMGKVIGKEGKVIRSIRNVMKIPAIKQNKRINISLTENPQ